MLIICLPLLSNAQTDAHRLQFLSDLEMRHEGMLHGHGVLVTHKLPRQLSAFPILSLLSWVQEELQHAKMEQMKSIHNQTCARRPGYVGYELQAAA